MCRRSSGTLVPNDPSHQGVVQHLRIANSEGYCISSEADIVLGCKDGTSDTASGRMKLGTSPPLIPGGAQLCCFSLFEDGGIGGIIAFVLGVGRTRLIRLIQDPTARVLYLA